MTQVSAGIQQQGSALLDVRELKTCFHTHQGAITAVDGVSFRVNRGEVVAIVGESGCGKSITAFSIMGLLTPPGSVDGGEILFEGRDIASMTRDDMRDIQGNKISMIFQEPLTSLNPLLTIGLQLDESVRLHLKLGKADARERSLEMLRKVGMPRPEAVHAQYPHELSGGMRQRVMIAMALSCNPALLLADEPTTALDVTVQAQILALMENLVKRFGSALILITHDLAVVSEMTHRVAVMYCGRVVEEGPTRELVHNPFHPYTKGLLESIPRLSGERSRRLPQIPGMVPNLFDLPPGCSFAPRCGYATELCRKEAPRMRTVAPGRMVSCHNPVQGGEEAEGHGR